MSSLEDLVLLGKPNAALVFRAEPYAKDETHRFLRDVVSLANARARGIRIIVIGVDLKPCGNREINEVPRDVFSSAAQMQSLVHEFVEPPIQVRLRPIYVSGTRLGLYEIRDCHDKPYMLRADHSGKMRRGDAWIRRSDATYRMGRREMEEIFAEKFRHLDMRQNVDVGFPGDFLGKECSLAVSNAVNPPSAVQSQKLHELIDAMKVAAHSGATTRLIRLTHARLFGADEPYQGEDSAVLEHELAQVRRKFFREDIDYFYGKHGGDLQLEVFNGSEEPLRDVSLSLVLPKVTGLLIAKRLPGQAIDGWKPSSGGTYPSVRSEEEAIFVAENMDDIPAGEKQQAFQIPLRFCARPNLLGKSIGIRYVLSASNLREPKRGRLKLRFVRSRSAVRV